MKRIYHTWEKWECYRAGFYEDHAPDGMTKAEAEGKYLELLANTPAFEAALETIITTWKHSCEHYLSNENMNRIAWLGQAAVALVFRVPADFRVGFNLLSGEQQKEANRVALVYLNKWIAAHGEKELSIEEAKSKTQMDLY